MRGDTYARWLTQAEAARADGRYGEAAECYLKASEADPHREEAYLELAKLLWVQGKHQKSVATLDYALGRCPDAPALWRKRGELALALGDYVHASEAFRRCLSLRPEEVGPYVDLGRARDAMGMREEAIECYRNALQLAPGTVEATARMALSMLEAGHAEDALAAIDRALEEQPGQPRFHHVRGLVLKASGDLAEARGAFERAIALDPSAGYAYRHLLTVTRCATDSQWIARMQQQMDALIDNDKERENFCFALGKAYEDIGEYGRSFEYYQEGNRLHRRLRPYDASPVIRHLDRLREAFTAQRLQGLRAAGVPDATPIFILGMPRSGTTLTEQILASHPEVYGAGELTTLQRLLSARVYAADPTGSLAENLDRYACPEVLRTVARAYLERLHGLCATARRVTDKMPHNFMHLGLIRVMFPGARIIHCTRHPVDTCLSLFKATLVSSHDYSHDLEDLGRYYAAYHRLMAHWRQLYPDGFLDFSYEALVADQRAQTESLLAYCDLPWDDRCLAFHEAERPVLTASHGQVRQPLYRGSVHGWRRYERQLQPLIRVLREEGVLGD